MMTMYEDIEPSIKAMRASMQKEIYILSPHIFTKTYNNYQYYAFESIDLLKKYLKENDLCKKSISDSDFDILISKYCQKMHIENGNNNNLTIIPLVNVRVFLKWSFCCGYKETIEYYLYMNSGNILFNHNISTKSQKFANNISATRVSEEYFGGNCRYMYILENVPFYTEQ